MFWRPICPMLTVYEWRSSPRKKCFGCSYILSFSSCASKSGNFHWSLTDCIKLSLEMARFRRVASRGVQALWGCGGISICHTIWAKNVGISGSLRNSFFLWTPDNLRDAAFFFADLSYISTCLSSCKSFCPSLSVAAVVLIPTFPWLGIHSIYILNVLSLALLPQLQSKYKVSRRLAYGYELNIMNDIYQDSQSSMFRLPKSAPLIISARRMLNIRQCRDFKFQIFFYHLTITRHIKMKRWMLMLKDPSSWIR